MAGGGRGTSGALETSGVQGIWDHPPSREAQGDGAAVGLRARESRVHGEGRQVSGNPNSEVREMRDADTILGIKYDTGEPGTPKGVSPVWPDGGERDYIGHYRPGIRERGYGCTANSRRLAR